MKITKVIIDKYSPKESGTCAEVSITLDNCLVVHNISVIKGDKGYFVAMPNTGCTKIHNNKKTYDDLIHPVSKNLSLEITNSVLKAFTSYEAKK